MAFLDNSGDIILDAVLTDTGRLRLAQGDGSFKISKFALGDDEINYELYDKNHASGSAYYDLEVLQTPVLEAFTNNTSNLKTKLVTMSRTNILYMPVLKLNKNSVGSNASPQRQALPSKTFARYNSTAATDQASQTWTNAANKTDEKFYIAVDSDTYGILTAYNAGSYTLNASETPNAPPVTGVIQGYPAGAAGVVGGLIRLDHGLDTLEISPGVGLDSDLLETAFIVELDYRLGRVKSPTSDTPTPVNFIDDDNVATYYITSQGQGGYINPTGTAPKDTNNFSAADGGPGLTNLALDEWSRPQVFPGPRGNTLQFRIQASNELQQSTYLFSQLGSSESGGSANFLGVNTNDSRSKDKNIYYLDSTVRIVGANTGYRLDIPVRFIKIAT